MKRTLLAFIAGSVIVVSVSGCNMKIYANAVPPQTTIKVVRVTSHTLDWFYHLDKRMINCPPGRWIKEAYNAIYYIPMGKWGFSARYGYQRRAGDTHKCQALDQAIRQHRPWPHPTETVIVTITPKP